MMYTSLTLASVVSSWLLTPTMAQFPPNGDPGVFIKMKGAFDQEENKLRSEATLDEGMMDRAIHFAKSKEKQKTIQEFIERGSLMLPGGDAVIEQNKDVGEQIIDPRTPKGFGNPFFRKIHVEENLDQKALISEAEEKAAKKLGKVLNPDHDDVGWKKFWANGRMSEGGQTIWNSEFLPFLLTSPNMIVRRTCLSCEDDFQEIFYRRYTPVQNRDLINVLVKGPFSGTDLTPNTCGVDFDLFSTYEDALTKTNPWQHCHTSSKGLPGYSGPNYHSDGQESCGNACQPDYAYYVEEGNWIPSAGAIEFHIQGSRDGTRIESHNINIFNQVVEDSNNKIIRRLCSECHKPYDDIYYRRYTEAPADLVWIMFSKFDTQRADNIMGQDFDIFSSLEDAIRKTNPWEYCAPYTSDKGFPAGCGPDYATHRTDQWQIYNDLGNVVGGVRRTGFFIQNDISDPVKFKQDWMTEDEEMMAFLYPDQYGKNTDDLGIQQCYEPGSPGADAPTEIADVHNGWYDVTRCGKCNDYCRWVPMGETTNCPAPSDKSGGYPLFEAFPEFEPEPLIEHVDEYSGWYDLEGCGECNDYCRWVSTTSGLSGGNPAWRVRYGSNSWWDCAPAGTNYAGMTYLPYYYGGGFPWGTTFTHGKCESQGSTSANAVVPTEGIDPRISTVGQEMQFSCIMSGGVGGTEPGHFDEFEHQKCSGQGADTQVSTRTTKFLGCYRDASTRAIPQFIGAGVSAELCENTCRLKGYHYFGRQHDEECYCGALSESDESYARYGKLDAAQCNYCEGEMLGGWANCVYQVLDQFDAKKEWDKPKCAHIKVQDTRKQCYIACRDKEKDMTNSLICAKLERIGMQWLAKDITKWLDSPVCANKDCSTRAHPLGKDVGRAKGTF